ncbi:hypothetical protein ACIPQH_24970 [Streptomyces rubiginosohelvolus]|uniref:hypothetical protein n=1 Tax=Streptomyces rubiginosohelvolus TaxID=67362 RepID=UPI0038085177
MAALEPERLTEIRGLVAELGTADVDRRLLACCRKALADVLADRDELAAQFSEIAEELATWKGSL